MEQKNYFEARNIDSNFKLRQVRKELPLFCSEFFIGIENKTAVLTRLNYAHDLRLFFKYLTSEVTIFRDKSVIDLQIDDLKHIKVTHIELFLEYLNLYVNEHGKNITNSREAKSRKLSAIRSLFKYFYNKGLLSEDISSKIAMPKINEKPITRLEVDEVVNLLNNAESGTGLDGRQGIYHKKTKLRDCALLTLFLGTGIRVSECIGLDVSDFDFKNLSFKVTRKGGNQVILYYSEEVLGALYDYLEVRDTFVKQKQELIGQDAMFLSIQGRRITVRAVENLVKKYAYTATPLKHITPHKLRSTYGTNLYRETQDIYVVAEVLGHKDINTTKKHYAATSEEIKRKASTVIKLRDKN